MITESKEEFNIGIIFVCKKCKAQQETSKYLKEDGKINVPKGSRCECGGHIRVKIIS